MPSSRPARRLVRLALTTSLCASLGVATAVYLAEVRGRVARGGWHHPWVFDRGLLRSSGPKVNCLRMGR